MDKPTPIHEEVSRAYTRAVAQPGTGCCGSSSATPKGVAAQSAGYTPEELAALPADAVANSFGCGNPLAFSEVKEGDVVLDLGSGAGIDLLIAARRVGPSGRVIGVDMTDAMIERACGNIRQAGAANVEVRKGLIEHLPVDDASVDWVVSNCVINLSPDKPAVFAEIARVLRPGGRMRVSDIVADDLPEVVRRDPALYCSCIAGAIGEAEYLDGLRRAGLVDVEVLERNVYADAQLEALVASELPAESRSCCGGSGSSGADVAGIARQLEGRVQSLRVGARKP